jgi:hypothetical protein
MRPEPDVLELAVAVDPDVLELDPDVLELAVAVLVGIVLLGALTVLLRYRQYMLYDPR